MLKTLMMTAASAALLASAAVAQQSPPVAPPAKQETRPPAATTSPTGAMQFVSQQATGQWLSTKFIGTDVIGANNEKVGDVTDILFDRDGRIMAYVVGVGGFLGIGTKDVALNPSAFQVQPETDREALKLRLAKTRDELRNAPEFKVASSRPSPTTGQTPPRDRAPTTPPAVPPVR